MNATDRAAPRPLTFQMRFMFLSIGSVVVFLGLSLFVLSAETDTWFAWTIEPSLTAAFLGAGYWAGLPLLWIAAREREWARARVVVPVAFMLDITLTIATFVHFDKFHTDTVIGWIWIVSYSIMAPALVVALVGQLRQPGGDPPRVARLQPSVKALFALQTTVLLGLGTALFVAPGTLADIWPWKLTDLTGRAVGGMLMTHGIAMAAVQREDDWARITAPMVSYAFLGALHCIVIARYADVLDWDTAGAWAYLLFTLSVLAAGAYGWLASIRSRRMVATSQPSPAAAAVSSAR